MTRLQETSLHARPATAATRDGFVLVTSLLILVVLTGLGAGALFLTSMNLRIAENTRSSTIAQYNAYEGLDIALLALAREYRLAEDGSWPTLGQVRNRMPPGSPFTIDSITYDPVGADGLVRGGTVVVRGQGPRNASYETSARFQGQLSPLEVDREADPLFGTGWVTEASIAIKGNTTFQIPLWAGQSISAQATKVIASSGNFAHSGFVSSGSPAGCTIFSQGTKYVQCQSGQTPPSVPTFQFDSALAELADEADVEFPACSGPNVHTFLTSQSVSASVYPPNATFCLGEGVTLTITGTATGLYVLGPRSSTVNVAMNSAPASTDPEEETRARVGVKIAAGTITQDTGSYVLAGENTLFAANSIMYQNTGSAMTNPGVISTLIGTEGNIEFRGNTSGTLNAVIWANGSVCKTGGGGLNFGGTILAGGAFVPGLSANCSRGIYWNGGGGGQFTTITNTNIPDLDDDTTNVFAAAGIRVLAKRP